MTHRSTLARYRVLVMIDSLLAGGAERIAVETACGLDATRFEAHVLVTRGTGPLEQQLVDAQIPYTILNRSRRVDLRAWRIARDLAAEADILHAHKFGSNVWAAALARRVDIPLLAHEHNFSSRAGVVRRVLDRSWISPVSSRIVCVSESVAETERQIGIPEQQIVVVPNGVRTSTAWPRSAAREELGLDEDAFVVGIVGRLRPEKAHDIALQAISQLCHAGRSVQLCVIGDGPRRDELLALERSLGLPSGVVHWAGERPDAARLAAAFDVALITSQWEGLPLAALEAIAADVPLVATAVGGLPNLLADGCGMLVAPGDVAGIAEHIARCMDDERGVRAIVSAARRRLREEYTFRRMVQRIEGLYIAAMTEHWAGAIPIGRGLPVGRVRDDRSETAEGAA
jgi:glycosyltransferase involved in cell wall biosynthesis